MAEREWQALVNEHANNIWRIAIVLLFLGLAIWAITLVYLEQYQGLELVIANSAIGLWLTTVLTSIGPELAGIVIGVVTIDYLNERRQDEQLKEQLILQMGSKHDYVTDTAIRALRARGWLSGGSLSGADLVGANLSEADLVGANLSEADLTVANLIGADLRGANLSEAKLRNVNLSWARLDRANLSGAHLRNADLSRADLFNANLSGADLQGANLIEATLWANLSGASLLWANLGGADLRNATLSGANLGLADLSEADLSEADLSEAKGWTIEQLEQAKTLVAAIMPDETQLGRMTSEGQKIEGPTFEAWKAQFLAKSKAEKVESGWHDTGDAELPEDA